MHGISVAVVGASGYTGLELTRLLARHPEVRLGALYSDRWSGERAGDRLALDGPAAAVPYQPLAEAGQADAGIVFLATPAEVSAALAPGLLARGARVIDLSGAFRLADPAAYPTARAQRAAEAADIYSFLFWQMGDPAFQPATYDPTLISVNPRP